ncbi:uracil-DNA glycosylase [Prochlorothrix hollandica]|uniref:uracil-DNA glycosylase n=1 Tax=Prochlorothrix hollandica TaxID=1223 RepID=UPI00034AAADE|nr:uracil-DNA glycosylase [Prochlorothrix hollandica]
MVPIADLLHRLNLFYPNATYDLHWQTPEQLLIATILAAQTTDERVNQVTAQLFQVYPDVAALAGADRPALEEVLRPTGYYRRKAATVQAVCGELMARFGGKVPPNLEALTSLPGVGRKTANVVLNCAFNQASGIIVDTHGIRVNQRLGLTQHRQADAIEGDLTALVPRSDWIQWGNAIIYHGRSRCTARSPQCDRCGLQDLCPQVGVRPAPKTALKAALQTAPTSKKAKSSAQQLDLLTSASDPASRPEDPKDWDLGAWEPWLQDELNQPYFGQLQAFVAQARRQGPVFPPADRVFRAFHLTPPQETRVLLLGQDPYHGIGQAQGLCFSVPPAMTHPPSLRNIFKELQADVGGNIPGQGDLTPWATQGVLLLNAVLTVEAHQANSHKDQGWEQFTDGVIRCLSDRSAHTVFILWGAYARRKESLIDRRHTILTSAHPSPFSARHGFFGSRPFSQTNAALKAQGQREINWILP